jgi:hypothetical protein
MMGRYKKRPLPPQSGTPTPPKFWSFGKHKTRADFKREDENTRRWRSESQESQRRSR